MKKNAKYCVNTQKHLLNEHTMGQYVKTWERERGGGERERERERKRSYTMRLR